MPAAKSRDDLVRLFWSKFLRESTKNDGQITGWRFWWDRATDDARRIAVYHEALALKDGTEEGVAREADALHESLKHAKPREANALFGDW